MSPASSDPSPSTSADPARSARPADRAIRALLYLTLLTPLVSVPGFFQPFMLPRAIFLRALLGLAVLAVAWAAWRGRLPEVDPRRDPVLVAILGFLAAYTVGALAGVSPLKSFFGESFRMWGVIAWIHFLVFYLLLRGWMAERDWIRYLAGAVAVSGVVSALALSRTVGLEPVIGLAPSEGGTIGNPGYLVMYLLVCLGLTAPLWRRAGRKGRAALAVVVLLDLAAIGTTHVRSAVLGLVVGGTAALAAAALWTGERRVRRWVLGGLGAMVVAGGLAVGAAQAGWLRGVPAVSALGDLRWTETGIVVRRMAWEAAADGTAERPWTGVGPENFGVVWQQQFEPGWHETTIQLADEDEAPHQLFLQRPHNVFVRAFAETGVIGGLFFLALFGGFLYAVDRARRRGGLGPWEAAGLVGMVAGYAVLLALWYEEYSGFPLFLAAAAFAVAAAGFGSGEGADEPDPEGGGGGLILALLLAGLVALSGYYHARLSAAAWWTHRAEATEEWSERMDHYDRLFAVRPPGAQTLVTRFAENVRQAGPGFRERRDEEAVFRMADRAVGRAILEMGDVIARDPESARLYAIQSGIYYYGGYYLLDDDRFLRRAVERGERAVELAPGMLTYRHQLAEIHIDAEQYGEAIAVLEGALEQFDGWRRTHRFLTRAHLSAGDTVSAARSLYHMGRLQEGWTEAQRFGVSQQIVPALSRAGRPALADSLRGLLMSGR